MSDVVLKVEGLGKCYRIGRSKPPAADFSGKIRDALLSPFSWLIDQVKQPAADELLWSLSDISFELERGDVIGIIGHNGAGKSTLLKILSRITEPTTGTALISGRVGALLEVGTGMHPELTGRENIYQNGCLLGMKKFEIDAVFDEIIDFSGVSKFIDTPVKRYSSGMRVRLGFAIAAHLEPEILIVDEVLAVGDVRFQQKCLGKMKEVATHGRTVLFVSHTMSAIRGMCNRGLYLEDGKILVDNTAEKAIEAYMSAGEPAGSSGARSEGIVAGKTWGYEDAPGKEQFRLLSLALSSGGVGGPFPCDAGIDFEIRFKLSEGVFGMRILVHVRDEYGTVIFRESEHEGNASDFEAGEYITSAHIPAGFLKPGLYRVGVIAGQPGIGRFLNEYVEVQLQIADPNLPEFTLHNKALLLPQMTWDSPRRIDTF